MKLAYCLVDVVKRGEEKPTFFVPAARARNGLCPGDMAKLIFNGEERMWVKVTEAEGRGRYVGKLWSRPIRVNLKFGDEIRFQAKHVADIVMFN
jgi:hypothetical protein